MRTRTTASSTAQPTCRLGMAAYSLASSETGEPPYALLPPTAPVSIMPRPASSRGGVIGTQMCTSIATAVASTSDRRAQR
ncbi:hypothetical protein V7S47_00520 [Nocardioides sp. CCNWLW216]